MYVQVYVRVLLHAVISASDSPDFDALNSKVRAEQFAQPMGNSKLDRIRIQLRSEHRKEYCNTTMSMLQASVSHARTAFAW